jgi:hypothetical protein
MDMERFNLKKLNGEEVNEQYQVTIKNMFALWRTYTIEDISKAWDTITENITISAKDSIGLCESKHHKTWSDEECLRLVDLRKQPN